MTSVSHDNYSTAETYSGRAAPWSQEAEQAVLGAMLLDQDAALRAAELVDDSMFYREAHRRLFRAMLALTEQRVVIDHITLREEMLWPTMERIETLQRSGKAITGVPSGFADLDEMTSGFQPSELIIVAARPSMGKTAFCLNIATQAAVDGFGVAVFSLEMSKEALVQRMLCAEARVDSQAVRRGSLRDPDFTRLARAAGILQSCPVWIDDSPALTLLEMRSKARRLKVENDVRLIIVDYLQLMRSPEYSENRVQEISDISRSLKGLARELKIPVIALSQLSRASEQRGGERRPI